MTLPWRINVLRIDQLRPITHINNQSSYPDLFLLEKTHINRVKLCSFDQLYVSWKKNEILFQTYLNIEEKERLLGWSLVKIFVYFQQIVPESLLTIFVIIPQKQILMKRIHLQLNLLILLQENFHLQDRLHIKYVKYLQILPTLNQHQKLLTVRR